MSAEPNSQERANFVSRDRCIACESTSLECLGRGRFDDGPVRGFIERDPWGVQPLPFLEGAPWEYLACRECGQAFHRYVLDDYWQGRRFAEWMGEEAMRKFAQERGLDSFAVRHGVGVANMAHVLRLELLTRSIRNGKPPSLLDFGCGNGNFAGHAGLSGFDAWGIDWDAHRLRAGVAGGVRLFRGLTELDADHPEPFHAVTMFEVLEHLVAPREVLRSLRQRMVPGGILVLETPDCLGVRGIQSEHDYACIHPLDHLNGFTPKTLTQFARLEGFEPIRTPGAWVTCDPVRVAKTGIKGLIGGLFPSKTQGYFRLSK